MPYTLYKLTRGHRWLILRMQELEYKSNNGGVCMGIARMGMQAILLNATELFDERLNLIHAIPLDQFKEKGRLIEEIFAFFDGIELHQSPRLYPQLFDPKEAPKVQNTQHTLPLLLPEILEKQGGLFMAKEFTGIYKKEELITYFESLQQTLKQATPPINQPVALTLSNIDHAIVIGYNPERDRWMFIDANQLPTIIFSDINQIAQATINALSKNNITAFSSNIYGMKADEEALNKCLNDWMAQETWKNIHTPSIDNINLTDSYGSSWLCLAIRSRCTEIVLALLDKGANPNLVRTSGASPLFIAAENGLLEIVLALINKGANLNATRKDGATPLFIAAENGYLEIVLALIDKGADINVACNNNITLLHIAAMCGHTKIVRALIDKGVNLNATCTNDITPLFLATQNGYIKIVQALIDKGADLNAICTNDITPLFIAAQNGYFKIVQALIGKGANLNAACTNGATPFFIAAQSGHIQVINLLMAAGANSELPLIRTAAELNEFALGKDQAIQSRIKLFIQAQPDINKPILITPWQIACIMGQEEVINCLRKHNLSPCLNDEIYEELHQQIQNNNACSSSSISSQSFTLFGAANSSHKQAAAEETLFLYRCFGSVLPNQIPVAVNKRRLAIIEDVLEDNYTDRLADSSTTIPVSII